MMDRPVLFYRPERQTIISPLLGLSYAGQLAKRASDNGFKVDLSVKF